MTTERWQQVRSLFEEALERGADDRKALLATRSPDPDVRCEVEDLLAAADAAGDFLVPDAETPPADPRIGQHVGHYRITRVLGIGGMGAVYGAERADGRFAHAVAVKLVRPGLLSGDVRDRFVREQRVLARLTHPGIARLYDGGVTDDGVPYVLMEAVDGTPLTDFADAHALDLQARVRLFLQVCEAVQYAHQNLVVHRDLKPHNILVTADGTVKLLDFGIARLLEDEDEGPVTQDGLRAFTPAYASPEQVRGEPVSTASDVYSLGVVLYELLSGERPYRVAGLSAASAERVVSETVPPPPSTRRDMAPRPAAGVLTRDLDAICLMALRKEPARRYASAQALADDLRCYLDRKPVAARPATLGYRAQSFVRRHRMAVTAAAALVVVLLTGIGATLWQARAAAAAAARAERRFALAHAASETLLFDVYDAVVDLPGALSARELLVQRGYDYLSRLADEAGDDAGLRLDLARGLLRVGNTQGNPNNANLGRLGDALLSYRRALTLLPDDAPTDSLDLLIRHTRGVAHEKIGDVLAVRGRIDSALAHLDTALAYYGRNAEIHVEDPSRRVVLAIGNVKRGDVTGNPDFPNAGRPEQALAYYERAFQLLDAAWAAGDTTMRVERMRGIVQERLGSVYDALGQFERAAQAFSRSHALRADLALRYPSHADVQRDLAIAMEKEAGVAASRGQATVALAGFHEASAIFRAIAEADPRNVNAQQSYAVSLLHTAEAAAAAGHGTEAARLARQAHALLLSLAEADPANARTASMLARADSAARSHR